MSDFNNYSFPKLQESLRQVLGELYLTTLALADWSQKADWANFLKSLERRETLLQQLKMIQTQCQQWQEKHPNQTLLHQWRFINRTVARELEKVAKVDQQILDTIKTKRLDMMNEIVKLHKGLAFLREYEKSVRPQSTVSELY